MCLIALSLIEQESVQILKQLGGYWGNISPCLVHYNSMSCPCISLLDKLVTKADDIFPEGLACVIPSDIT
jgi:hypothetical protein